VLFSSAPWWPFPFFPLLDWISSYTWSGPVPLTPHSLAIYPFPRFSPPPPDRRWISEHQIPSSCVTFNLISFFLQFWLRIPSASFLLLVLISPFERKSPSFPGPSLNLLPLPLFLFLLWSSQAFLASDCCLVEGLSFVAIRRFHHSFLLPPLFPQPPFFRPPF